MVKSSSTVTGLKRLDHWIPVPEGRGRKWIVLNWIFFSWTQSAKSRLFSWSHDYWVAVSCITVRLTFALKHSNKLWPHGHCYVGDEAGRNLLAVAQQVVARPQEQIRQVAQEVGEAPSCCCHIGCRGRRTRRRLKCCETSLDSTPCIHLSS